MTRITTTESVTMRRTGTARAARAARPIPADRAAGSLGPCNWHSDSDHDRDRDRGPGPSDRRTVTMIGLRVQSDPAKKRSPGSSQPEARQVEPGLSHAS